MAVAGDDRLSDTATEGELTLASGAKLQRHETHLRHPGAGAEVRIDGLYLLGGKAHADLPGVVDALRRDQVSSLYLGPGFPRWCSSDVLYITWVDQERGGTFNLRSGDARSMRQQLRPARRNWVRSGRRCNSWSAAKGE